MTFDTMRRPNPKDPIRDTRLVQRLEKPFSFGVFKDNPFSFGGGLKNGGLSEKDMEVLRRIFSFDYMGAAEFEYGIIPATLSALSKNRKWLVTATVKVPYADVHVPLLFPRNEIPSGDATVYIIAYKNEVDEVARRIRAWAKGESPTSVEYDGRMELKAYTRLASSLLVDREHPSSVCGWLECDNGFFFFTDREMWQNTAAMFGLDLPLETKEAI